MLFAQCLIFAQRKLLEGAVAVARTPAKPPLKPFPGVCGLANQSTPNMSPDLNLQPNEEPLEDMRLVQQAPCNLPFDTHELNLM